MFAPVHTALLLLTWTLLTSALAAAAQDLEPRAYSASPVGTNFIGIGFGRSSGEVAFDPTLPITNANATLYSPALGVGRTFGVLGKQALFTSTLPYAWGNISGDVGDQQGRISRSGLADVKTRLSINLRGSPAMTPAEFARRPHRRLILGTSLTMTSPSGQYDNTKLINLGTNRWSFKPEVGISYPLKKLDLDLYAGIWFFTPNKSFYTGHSSRSQDSLTAIQAHASYTFRRSLWAAIDATWYGGGASVVNDGVPSERQANTRLGATLALPITRRQSFKLSYSSGVTGNIGSKFNTIAGGWQYVWFGRP
ncbi:outer membrane putative beta-barrel porin/alpha-amylase [Edaphobacter modestus]|uniref:Outer membrane putative beta-barrel porin/alpha-amylase n=2 Tax=Edaphobacter modestus TaxID=388466 RepID=A0A4Q7YU72_9BACT|nr:outer membrane putative beta-barrel porin/alpha-amylase [Edaphobacter modestus]